MSDWFRNSEWNPEIEAAFEARLARSRSQKAQNLRIQGSTLKDSNPEVAVRLLERCAALGDDFQTAHALLDLAHAWYRLGDVEQALIALEATMEQEIRQPIVQTSAPFDYAMLVVLHDRTERFDRALDLLESKGLAILPVMDFQRESARAIILAAKGRRQEAREAAERAIAAESAEGWFPGYPEVGKAPAPDNPLSIRVREILADGAA